MLDLLVILRNSRLSPIIWYQNPGSSGGSRQITDLVLSGSKDPSDLKSLVSDAKGGTEVRAITDTLDQTNWNRKEAARRLNISYKALLNKIQRYGLDQDTYAPGRTEPLYH
jgi:DNA-binding NtrC family response regulator